MSISRQQLEKLLQQYDEEKGPWRHITWDHPVITELKKVLKQPHFTDFDLINCIPLQNLDSDDWRTEMYDTAHGWICSQIILSIWPHSHTYTGSFKPLSLEVHYQFIFPAINQLKNHGLFTEANFNMLTQPYLSFFEVLETAYKLINLHQSGDLTNETRNALINEYKSQENLRYHGPSLFSFFFGDDESQSNELIRHRQPLR